TYFCARRVKWDPYF
nr:immunoglobulin heavy chain junction region [Mus musculus]